MRSGIAFLLAVALLAGCAPKPADKSEGDEPKTAPSNPFFGTWSLASSQIAPWWDKKGDVPAADPAFKSFTLAANKSSGPPILACDKPEYAVSIVEPQSLFEGSLADPAAEAEALGFKDKSITTMNFSCKSSANDISLDFPMIDGSTILLGLDNVIYKFKLAGS